MLKTNVDKILDVLSKNNTISANDIASQIGISSDAVMAAAKNLEEEGTIRIDHKFMKPYLVLLKKQDAIISDPDEEDLTSDINKKYQSVGFGDMPEQQAADQNEYVVIAPQENKYDEMQQQNEAPVMHQEPNIDSSAESHEPEFKEPEIKNTFAEPILSEPAKDYEPNFNDSESKNNYTTPIQAQPEEKHKLEFEETKKTKEVTTPFQQDFRQFENASPKYEEEKKEIWEEAPAPEIQIDIPDTDSFSAGPNYSDAEKIDILLSQANDDLATGKTDIVVEKYKEIYKLYNESLEMSIPEKEMIKDKITVLFNKIKDSLLTNIA